MIVTLQALPAYSYSFQTAAIMDRDVPSAKFTAVNRSLPSPTPSKIFGFRPQQPTAPEPFKGGSQRSTSSRMATIKELGDVPAPSHPHAQKTSRSDSHSDYPYGGETSSRKRSFEAFGNKDKYAASDEPLPQKKRTGVSESGKTSPRSKGSEDPVWPPIPANAANVDWSAADAESPARDDPAGEDLPLDRTGMSTSPEDQGDSTETAKPTTEATQTPPRQERKRQYTKRTKSGCLTCRRRKKKCGEEKPVCLNCKRGGHNCDGYGDKRSTSGITVQSRLNPPLQSKIPERPLNATQWPRPPPPPQSTGWEYHDFGRPQAEPPRTYEGLTSERRDNWKRGAPSQSPMAASTTSRISGSSIPPMQELVGGLEPRDADQEKLANAARYGQSIAPATVHGRYPMEPPRPYYAGTSSSYRSASSVAFQSANTEKEKMLQGQYFLAYIDGSLAEDRKRCQEKVERYINATRPSSGTSESEIGRLFLEIVNRKMGHRCIVRPPFSCEYGYNITIGSEVFIGENCRIQDSGKITIGDRVIIGPDAKLYSLALPTDPKFRRGNQGLAIARPIVIEDDAVIEGNVTIMPGVIIRKGAIVCAGTVVREDVQSNVVVSGNPMRIERTIGPNEELEMRPPAGGRSDYPPANMNTEHLYYNMPPRR